MAKRIYPVDYEGHDAEGLPVGMTNHSSFHVNHS
jgi:hypothetical protein